MNIPSGKFSSCTRVSVRKTDRYWSVETIIAQLMAEMTEIQDMWLHQLTICRDVSNAKVSHDLGINFNEYVTTLICMVV